MVTRNVLCFPELWWRCNQRLVNIQSAWILNTKEWCNQFQNHLILLNTRFTSSCRSKNRFHSVLDCYRVQHSFHLINHSVAVDASIQTCFSFRLRQLIIYQFPSTGARFDRSEGDGLPQAVCMAGKDDRVDNRLMTMTCHSDYESKLWRWWRTTVSTRSN